MRGNGLSGHKSLIGRIRWIGWRSAFAVGIAGFAGAGSAALATVALAARSSVAAHSAAPGGLDVLPFPGTPDAAPKTNIDFPAVSPAQVASVSVVGSRTGLHSGRLSAQPGGHGAAFSPNRSFAQGERVSVIATFRSPAAGTATGAPGKRRVSFSFSVARLAGIASGDGPDAAATAAARRGASSRTLTHSFVTEPNFRVPIVTMRGKDPDPTAGDIFLDAEFSGQNAAYFLGPRGRLLWYHPSAAKGEGLGIRNTRVQRYNGQPVLTYWQGKAVKPPGGGRGVDLMVNEHYQTIDTIRPGDGYENQGADPHEFVLGHEGREATAFIQLWLPVQANLSSVGGPQSGPTFDWIVQEIDIATGKVIWDWHSLGHVPLDYSYSPYIPAVPYDYFHLNSIQQLPSGNILISSRNTWAVYLIDKKTGKIIWTLGGKHSSFKMGPHTNFEWQHDATLHNNGMLTLFDDGATPREERQSRALELHISTAAHRATLIHAFTHSPPALATAQGSVQVLADRNVFVGWGRQPYFSEYTPSGKQIFGGTFRAPVESQRAYRNHDWVGRPLQPPAIAVRHSSTPGRDFVYASWNGATGVAKWQVLVGRTNTGPFTSVKTVRWSSFETRIPVGSGHSYFEVAALGVRGKVLPHGTSAAVAGP